jgi:hypothetical protein
MKRVGSTAGMYVWVLLKIEKRKKGYLEMYA